MKLLELHLPPPVLKWVSDCIDDRTARVWVPSLPLSPPRWRPSNIYISLLFYILFVQNIPTSSQKHDGHFIRHRSVRWWHRFLVLLNPNKTSRPKPHPNLNDLLGYCNKWRIQLNTAKTTLLLLIRCFRHTLTVKVPGRSLYPWLVPTKTFTSRITLDSTLNFQMHPPPTTSFRTVNNRYKVCSSRLPTTLYTAALTFGQPLFNSKPEIATASLKQTERRAILSRSHASVDS